MAHCRTAGVPLPAACQTIRVPAGMVLPDIRISPMTQPWDAALQRLLLEGVLSGFALIDLNGESVASYGALCDEPIVAQQLQSLFQTGPANCRAGWPLRCFAALPPTAAHSPPTTVLATLHFPAPLHPCSCGTRASRHLRPASHHHTEIRQQRICRCVCMFRPAAPQSAHLAVPGPPSPTTVPPCPQ